MTLLTPDNALIGLAILALYLVVPRRWSDRVLLAGSLALVARLTGPYAVVFAWMTLGTWLTPRASRRWPRAATAIFAFGVAANLAALALFKYRPSTLHGVGLRLLGQGAPEALGPVVVPLGISYFALQAISYLADVRRGRASPSSGLVEVALYLLYFPKFLAGPVERAGEFLARLAAPRRIDNERLARSSTLIVLGLARKFVIANPLFAISGLGDFQAGDAPAGLFAAAALAAYVFAVYNDFAGYTNLAQGISAFFGLDLSPNFRQPFFAQGFADFWSRWHASLTGWLKEYVYFPLTRVLLRASGGRASAVALVAPPVLTLLASGLWHGACAQLIGWGGVVGVLMALESVIGRAGWARRWRAIGAASVLRSLAVTVGMSLSVVLFALPVPEALTFWRSLVAPSAGQVHPALLPLLGVSLLLDALQGRAGDDAAPARWPLPLRASGLALAVLLTFLALRASGPRVFIYQGF